MATNKIYETLSVENDEAVLIVTLNRPAQMNAINRKMADELTHAVDEAQAGSARCLLLTGAGRAFCSGADLNGGWWPQSGPVDAGLGLETHFNPLLLKLRELPLPIVVAVNGAAAGGGCSYALAGDVVIAARSAYFLQPFAAIGLIPDVGSTWMLPRLVGRARAMAMMLLGDRISADEAARWGLIWKTVDDEVLMRDARALAKGLASGPTTAYVLMRRAVDVAANGPIESALAFERDGQRVSGCTADHREGVTAFLEKRTPRFRGK